MEKPIIVKYKELRESILNEINKSGLPAFLIETILKDLYLEASRLAFIEYQTEKESYEKAGDKDANNQGDNS